MKSSRACEVPDFPIRRALVSTVSESKGQLKYETAASSKNESGIIQLEGDFDEFAGPDTPTPAAVADGSSQPRPTCPEPEPLFKLGSGISVHGQKHIWDNISGDILEKLEHFKPVKESCAWFESAEDCVLCDSLWRVTIVHW